MWLSVCVLALLLSGAEAGIMIRTRDAAANIQTASRFVGLAYNLLKADPDAAEGGGVDPGFRTTRRVVVQDSNNLASFPRYSCVTRSSTSTVYDEKSFQRKFDLGVDVEAGVSSEVVEAQFALSTSFSEAKDQTTKERKMTLEVQTLCNLGKARLKTELDTHKASQSFQAAVCRLPAAYDQAAYVRFIDDWGTNFVLEVDVGIRNLTKKVETFSSVYQSLQKQFALSTSLSASYSGAIYTVSGSIAVDMSKVDNSQQLKEAFTGNEIIKTIGTDAYPEPIKVKLASIHDMLEDKYFAAPNPSACTAAALSQLSTKKTNLARALNEYPAAKNAVVTASNGLVKIPLNWPRGTYGLVKPKTSCPSGWTDNGYRKWDCEDDNNRNRVSSFHNLDGVLNHDIHLKFCVKREPYTNSQTDTDWPVGEYCILQYRSCPEGFSPGNIYWDDEDDDNANTHGGTLPDGVFGADTRLYTCCRTDGYPTIPIFLPTDQPFYLMQADSYGCQKVYGMNFHSEKMTWDTEDYNCGDSATATAPYREGPCDWTLFFCYYW